MMAGPTTEILNDDIRILRGEVHGVDLDVRELNTKVDGIITSIKILGIFTLASLLSGVWWGGSLTVKVDNLERRIDKLETKIEKLEAKVDARFDKIDAALGKLIEQSKPAPKP